MLHIKQYFWIIFFIVSGVLGQEAPIYSFSFHVFSTCGATGRDGPTITQAKTAYNAAIWTQNPSYFDVVNGVQIWTVPASGLYKITAAGAAGGGQGGGNGAVVFGVFDLVRGEKIKIIVGQRGLGYPRGWKSGGGGGGTFVVRAGPVALLVAGGGGGGGGDGSDSMANSSFPLGGNALPTSLNGISTSASGGGTYGNGGNHGFGIYNPASGGGGFYTKGVDAIYNSKTLSTGGKSFFDDGQGGLGGSSNGPVASSCHGGFGGGGGCTWVFNAVRGGGGGGWSGGQGGTYRTTILQDSIYAGDYLYQQLVGGGAGSINQGDEKQAYVDSEKGDGSVSVELITCNAGQRYERGVGCVICPVQFFSLGGSVRECQQCPDNSDPYPEPGGNYCNCRRGFEMVDGKCVACKAGYFKKNAGNDTTCLPCRVGTYQPNTGFEWCSACESGKYASVEGSVTCSSCGLNAISNGYSCLCFENNFGNPYVQCSPCGSGTVRPGLTEKTTTSADCVPIFTCPAGTQPNGNRCVPCPPGTAKATKGNETCSTCLSGTFSSENAIICTTCPPNQYSKAGASSCIQCGVGATSQEGESQCNCLPGYFAEGTACIPCKAGYYKAGISNRTFCDRCPSNQFSFSGAGGCSTCGTNSVPKDDLTGCLCNFGYTKMGGSCDACPLGTEKSVIGDEPCTGCKPGFYANQFATVQCLSCRENTFSTGGAVTCLGCGIGASSIAGSSYCSCSAGYYQSGSECLPCRAGTFKQASGNGTGCTSCSSGQTSVAGAERCMSCPLGSTSTSDFSACVCKAGYTNSGSSCVACKGGTAKSNDGNGPCIECLPGFYSFEAWPYCNQCGDNQISTSAGASFCTPCQASTIPNSERTACVCPPNTTMSTSGLCTQNVQNPIGTTITCSTGQFYKDATLGCQKCATGTYAPVSGLSQCLACGSGATSSSDATSCLCIPGFEPSGTGNQCLACRVGTFKNSLGNNSCSACPSSTTALSPGSTSCVCAAGYGQSGNGCFQCESGTFKNSAGNATCSSCIGNMYTPTPGAVSCQACPVNSETTPKFDGCLCNQGYYSSSTGICSQCGANEYSTKGASSCLKCGDNAGSPPGSSSCLCLPGFFASGNLCVPCPAGMFKWGHGNETCTACSGNQISNPGSTTCQSCGSNSVFLPDSLTCVCNAGYYASGDNCVPCMPGTEKSFIGNTSSCDSCPIGKFSAKSGSIECTLCPEAETATKGSAQCICKPGYYRVGTQCVKCAEGSYKSTGGDGECTLCQPNTFLSVKGATENSCQPCASGLISPAGSYKCYDTTFSDDDNNNTGTGPKDQGSSGNANNTDKPDNATMIAAMAGGGCAIAGIGTYLAINYRKKQRAAIQKGAVNKITQKPQKGNNLSQAGLMSGSDGAFNVSGYQINSNGSPNRGGVFNNSSFNMVNPKNNTGTTSVFDTVAYAAQSTPTKPKTKPSNAAQPVHRNEGAASSTSMFDTAAFAASAMTHQKTAKPAHAPQNTIDFSRSTSMFETAAFSVDSKTSAAVSPPSSNTSATIRPATPTTTTSSEKQSPASVRSPPSQFANIQPRIESAKANMNAGRAVPQQALSPESLRKATSTHPAKSPASPMIPKIYENKAHPSLKSMAPTRNVPPGVVPMNRSISALNASSKSLFNEKVDNQTNFSFSNGKTDDNPTNFSFSNDTKDDNKTDFSFSGFKN